MPILVTFQAPIFSVNNFLRVVLNKNQVIWHEYPGIQEVKVLALYFFIRPQEKQKLVIILGMIIKIIFKIKYYVLIFFYWYRLPQRETSDRNKQRKKAFKK